MVCFLYLQYKLCSCLHFVLSYYLNRSFRFCDSQKRTPKQVVLSVVKVWLWWKGSEEVVEEQQERGSCGVSCLSGCRKVGRPSSVETRQTFGGQCHHQSQSQRFTRLAQTEHSCISGITQSGIRWVYSMLQKLIGDIYQHSQPPSCTDHPLENTFKKSQKMLLSSLSCQIGPVGCQEMFIPSLNKICQNIYDFTALLC